MALTLSRWAGSGGVAIAYTIATITSFAAIPLLGGVRATMKSNLVRNGSARWRLAIAHRSP
jgi:hypothetical protein